MKKLTEQFNTIAVKKGEIFAIELDASAADGGYLWDTKVASGKAAILSQETVFEKRDPMAFGGGGLKRIFLRADEAGQIEIVAKLRRPWEHSQPPIRQVNFKVSAS
jgi:predicted secreted protein